MFNDSSSYMCHLFYTQSTIIFSGSTGCFWWDTFSSLFDLIALTEEFSYGSPGVEFYGHHSSSIAVNQIYFLPGQVSFNLILKQKNLSV